MALTGSELMAVKTLQVRIVGFVIGLLVAMAITVALAVWFSTSNHSNEQIDDNLWVAESTLRQLLSNREEQLLSSAEVLTSDFGFKQAVASRDKDTIESVLHNHGERIGADLMVLLSLQGELLTSDALDINTQFNQDFFIRSTLNSGGANEYLLLNNQLYQVILLPVKAPLPIAIAMVGFELNQELANQWKTVTGLEVTFYAQQDTKTNIVASTLPQAEWDNAINNAYMPNSPQRLPLIARPKFASLKLDLSQSNLNDTGIFLSYPVEKAFREFDLLQWRIFIITLLGAVLALAGGILMAKNLASPIQFLATTASRIANGEFGLKVMDQRNTREINELASAFETMQQGLADREARIMYQAHHDPLTRLINRQHAITLLAEHLDSANYEPIAVICINILDFRIVNDTFGHVVGDQCLKLIAERMSSITGDNSFAARLGGDEFLLAVPSTSSQNQLADNILELLSSAYRIQELEITLKFSMGVSSAPKDSTLADQLVQKASIALDMARREQLGVAFYDNQMEETHMKRLQLLADLKNTLAANDGQLQMYFQPKVKTGAAAQFRFEALIRWIHPEQGFIPPDLFIPLAEQAGLIGNITDWVVEAVIKQIAHWKEQHFNAQVAINLSAKDLSRSNLLDSVHQQLDRYQLNTNCLAFEITESEIMCDAQQGIELLNRFRDSGFDLAIDDFGTGYSSLSQLKHMPVTELKIDKSFVLQLDQLEDDQIIVKSTIALAHSFNLKVVAEGVENQQSMDLLSEWGCDWLQGFYLSRPLPAKDVLSWVEDFTSRQQQAANH